MPIQVDGWMDIASLWAVALALGIVTGLAIKRTREWTRLAWALTLLFGAISLSYIYAGVRAIDNDLTEIWALRAMRAVVTLAALWVALALLRSPSVSIVANHLRDEITVAGRLHHLERRNAELGMRVGNIEADCVIGRERARVAPDPMPTPGQGEGDGP